MHIDSDLVLPLIALLVSVVALIAAIIAVRS